MDSKKEGEALDNLLTNKITYKLLSRGFAVMVLVVIIGAFASQQYKKQRADLGLSTNQPPAEQVGDGTPPPVSDATPPVDQPPLEPGEYDRYRDQQCKQRLPVLASKSGLVTWQIPERLKGLHIFADRPQEVPSEFINYYTDINYKVGTITSGKYAGGDIMLVFAQPDGPSVSSQYHIVRFQGSYYYLAKYSDPLPGKDDNAQFAIKLISDKTFELADLSLPKTIQSAEPSVSMTYAANYGFFKNGSDFFCLDYRVKVFSDPKVGDVYTDRFLTAAEQQNATYRPQYGFYIQSPDGLSHTYTFPIPFVGKDNVPVVTWTNGKANTHEYGYQSVGGCGVNNFVDNADVAAADLIQTGSTFTGQPIYEYKNSKADDLQFKYDSLYIAEGQAKISYANFIAGHPLFFWKDPFGRFIRFSDKKYQPLAECGKPVIYLYPTKTQRVHVEVAPQGGMSVSDPAYGTGWNVLATPESKLTNLADGKTYPYLFWEGRGGMYATPPQGFSVKREDVHSFLTGKLYELGLNAQESADFIEFWEPKMQAAPYYFVTFMGNDIMNALAPLAISPKPDTVIRVLMDFTPLQQPAQVMGYAIRTPVRKGFTVVEWGGVLR